MDTPAISIMLAHFPDKAVQKEISPLAGEKKHVLLVFVVISEHIIKSNDCGVTVTHPLSILSGIFHSCS